MNSSDIARLASVYTSQQVVRLAELFSSVDDLITQSSRAPLALQKKIPSIPPQVAEEYITYLDSDWPPILNHISPRCVCLFYRGNRSLLSHNNNSFGIVGSRTVTEYGSHSLHRLLTGLDFSKVPIVSGLAYGFDVLAHQYALQHNFPAIAVVGGGIAPNVMYPKEHWSIVQKIVAHQGLVVSEYPQSMKPQAFHFPLRNRIIAALSDVVFVVQASIKSGTLITAELALEIGHEVATIPARLDDELFAGNIRLLQQGAQLIRTSEDIQQLLQLPRIATPPSADPVLDILSQGGYTTEELSVALSLNLEELLPQLTLHEIAGKITQRDGRWLLL